MCAASGERLKRVAALTLVLSAATACGRQGQGAVYSGTLQTESASVGSLSGGRVAGVLVASGDRVRAGQTLVVLDARQLQAQREAATAQVRRAEATLADLEAGPRAPDVQRAFAEEAQAGALVQQRVSGDPPQLAAALAAVAQNRAELASAAARARYAVPEAARERQLFASGDVSAQRAQAAEADSAAARAAVDAAVAALRANEAQLVELRASRQPGERASAKHALAAEREGRVLLQAGSRPDQIVAARADLADARASLRLASARLDETVVRAPRDGLVEDVVVHVGDLIAAGAALATVTPEANPYARVYVPQRELGGFPLNAEVGVAADAFPGKRFTGRVEQIDRQGQFTPRDVQTADDRADVVFGVKIRVHDPGRELRPGTTVEVSR